MCHVAVGRGYDLLHQKMGAPVLEIGGTSRTGRLQLRLQACELDSLLFEMS